MQAVSSKFTDAVSSSAKSPRLGCLVSWKKNLNSAVSFFRLDSSLLDGPDVLKGAGDVVTFFDKYDYHNERSYVKGFTVTRKISSRPWGVIMATAELELSNATKRFLPGFDSDIGDYVGLPERPIKLNIGYNGESINLFTGYTSRPDNQLGARTTKITAYDAMTFLSGKKSSLEAFVNVKMDEIIKALLLEQGFSENQFVIEKSLQRSIGYYASRDKYVTNIFTELCEAEAYLLFADEDGIIHGWNRLHFLGTSDSVWSFSFSNMTDIRWSTAAIINSAKAIAKPYKVADWNSIWSVTQASSDTLVPANGSKEIFAEFKDDENNECMLVEADAPVYIDNTIGSSTYSTNRASDGSGEDAANYITLSSIYNFGNKYLMTFTNSANFPIYITNIQLFGKLAKVDTITGVTQENDDSIQKYGINQDNGRVTYEMTSSVVQDAATANTMAWLLVHSFGDPLSRLDIDNFIIPHLQIGDTVGVSAESMSKSCNIMGIKLAWGENMKLTQSLYCEERSQLSYFVLDKSKLDGTARLML